MFLILSNFLICFVFAIVEPPENIEHPGSIAYEYEYEVIQEEFLNRESLMYIPKNIGYKVPVIFFGHGQALGIDSYDETFKHFAKKGFAIVWLKYDSGFFDQKWRRMASDFNEISKSFLEKYNSILDASNVVYTGHSKGAYIALMAAGAPNALKGIKDLVLFAPAGYDQDYIKSLPKDLPVTIAYGDSDTIIKRGDVDEIYSKIKVDFKQFIEVTSYEHRESDHYVILNKSSFFGGENGVSGFHFYGVWKWIGGALDESKSKYLYGQEAVTTGVRGLSHKLIRN